MAKDSFLCLPNLIDAEEDLTYCRIEVLELAGVLESPNQ